MTDEPVPPGSLPLNNSKRELFAQGVAEGLTAEECQAKAGYTVNRKNGTRMTSNEDIAARAAYLKAQVAEIAVKKLAFDLTDTLTELAKLGFSNMQDYVEVNNDGTASVNMAELSREQFAAISEIQTETVMIGKGDDMKPLVKTKLKIADKRGPLTDIVRHFGGFIDKKELTGKDGAPIEVVDTTDKLALARAVMDILTTAEIGDEKNAEN